MQRLLVRLVPQLPQAVELSVEAGDAADERTNPTRLRLRRPGPGQRRRRVDRHRARLHQPLAAVCPEPLAEHLPRSRLVGDHDQEESSPAHHDSTTNRRRQPSTSGSGTVGVQRVARPAMATIEDDQSPARGPPAGDHHRESMIGGQSEPGFASSRLPGRRGRLPARVGERRVLRLAWAAHPGGWSCGMAAAYPGCGGCGPVRSLQVAAELLLPLDRLEQRLEVALAEAERAVPLDQLEEHRRAVLHGLGEDLQQVAVLVPVDQDRPARAAPRSAPGPRRSGSPELVVVGVGRVRGTPRRPRASSDGGQDVVGGERDVLRAGAAVELEVLVDLRLALAERPAR